MTTLESSARWRRAYLVFSAMCIAIGVVLHGDVLRGRLLADDWDHYAMSVGIYPTPRSAFNHFAFIGASESDHRALQQLGRLPWWIPPDLHMELMRPLASALGELDYVLLDAARHPARMHLHSLAWWIVLLAGVGLLLQRLVPLPAAGLALLLYVFDDAHIVPVTWAANRSELIANACCVWALYYQLRATEEQRLVLCVVAWGLVLCALLAGEHAVPALAYAAVFGATRAFGGPQRFRRWVFPLTLAIIGYFSVQRLLGFGAAGLGMYIDPLSRPVAFLRACVERLPLLFGDAVFGIAAELYPGGPPFRPYLFGLPLVPLDVDWAACQRALGWLALSGSAAAIVALAAHARRERVQVALACLLVAAAISLLPMCASVPMSRLTLPAALGFDTALGYVVFALTRCAWRSRSTRATLAAAAISFPILWVQVIHAAERTRRGIQHYVTVSHVEEDWVADPALDLGGRDVMLVSGGWATHWVVPFVRHLHELPTPRSFQPLSAAFLSPHVLERVADDIVDLHIPTQRFAKFVGSVYRTVDRPFYAGQRFDGLLFDVQVLAVDLGEPTQLRFHFRDSIDSERYVFLHSASYGLTRIIPPKIGDRLELPLASAPSLHSRP